jgi:hypothetical protein
VSVEKQKQNPATQSDRPLVSEIENNKYANSSSLFKAENDLPQGVSG